ncbi:hypothetical protein BDZ45DRAFT_682227 [Acephala macrosclerotiorum]|nr:hypothetical protein BDZ45DRAFT_682227 [Acephala macrosclerotiorum]
MSACREGSLAISQPTTTFLHLVEHAARDCRDRTISAEEKPVTKLNFTSSCADVQKEFIRSYQDKIEPGSSTATVFDPNKIESWWIPEVFVLTEGSFRIRPLTSAVVIPLVKVGNPTIEYYDSRGVTSSIDWNVGSVIYLAGDSSLKTDGRGNTSFIFFLFRMK